ncbi:8181_t:CDS:1, partial [Rhizophagus irregularis]
SSLYQKKREQCLTNVAKTQSSSYVPQYYRSLQNRKIQQKIRHARMTNS